MFSFFKKNKNLHLVCLIDGGKVSSLIVSVNNRVERKILAEASLEVSLHWDPESKSFETRLLTVLKDCLKRLKDSVSEKSDFKFSNSLLSDAQIFISHPWHISRIIKSSLNSSKAISLDYKFIADLVRKEESKLENEILKNPISPFEHKSIQMIEREFAKIALNGYETELSYSKKVNSLDLSLYMSVTLHELITNVGFELRRIFSIRDVFFHTLPLVIFRKIEITEEPDALLIIVAQESTYVINIENKKLSELKQFNIGNATIRRMMLKKRDIDNLRDKHNMAENEELSIIEKDNHNRESSLLTQNWVAALQSAIGGVFNTKNIFLITTSDISSNFSDDLKRIFPNSKIVYENTIDNLIALETSFVLE